MTTELPNKLKVQVRAIRSSAEGVRELVLGPATDAPLPAWTPGAHVDLLLAPDLVRQYSLCGNPGDPTWRVAVLRGPTGRGGSELVHDVLGVGDVLAAQRPCNHFGLDPAPAYLFGNMAPSSDMFELGVDVQVLRRDVPGSSSATVLALPPSRRHRRHPRRPARRPGAHRLPPGPRRGLGRHRQLLLRPRPRTDRPGLGTTRAPHGARLPLVPRPVLGLGGQR